MKKAEYLCLGFSLAIYILISYFTPRENFNQLLLFYTMLFGCYVFIVKPFSKTKPLLKLNYNTLFIVGLIFRIVLLFSIPNLSDDFYRFYWDGLLVNNGISPFAYLPSQLINGSVDHYISGITSDLLYKLNSQNYFSIYPPVCQVIFCISAWLFPNNIIGAVIVLKLFMLLFELGSFLLGKKLLQNFALPASLIFIYWLNPLVIIELVGNIHFEAGMIFFLLASICFLSKSEIIKYYSFQFPYFNAVYQSRAIQTTFNTLSLFDKNLIASALCFALAVSTKLIPLMLLPFFLKRLGFVRVSIYIVIVTCFGVLSFVPFINIQQLLNLQESVQLYFAKFEFNASIYYVARSIGYQIKGWNMIAEIGAMFSKLVFIIIIFKALSENTKAVIKCLPSLWLFALTVYLVFATIVHPWYILPLLALSIFSSFRFTVLWTYLIFLSYHVYASPSYTENLWLVFLEYSVVMLYLIYELIKARFIKPTHA